MWAAQSGGILISKVITLNVNNNTQSLDCFSLTGSVWVRRLYGVIADATTLTNCTAASWDLYEATGPTTVQMTANTGVLSGMAAGTVFVKAGLAAAAFTINNNAAGAVAEPAAAGPLFSESLVTQRTAGVATKIRFTYTSTDTPASALIVVYCMYSPVTAGSLLAPA